MPSRSMVSVALILIVLCPATFGYAALATSATAGTSIIAAILICLFVGVLVDPRAVSSPLKVTLLLSLGLALHGAFAALLLPFDFVRAGGSLLPLGLVVFTGYVLASLLARSPDGTVDRAVGRTFTLLLLVALLGVVGLEPPSPAASPKPMFPFTEPSLFALVFLPLLMFSCVRSGGAMRWLALLLGFTIAAIMENLTLMVGCVLVAFVCMRTAASALLLCVGVLVAGQFDLSYYTSRLDLSEDTQNISTLVYIQGWQLLQESLSRSAGWGIGFQQLGLAGSSGSANTTLLVLIGETSNIFDGGFVFAKLIGELGLFGLLLVALYLRRAWRALRVLRRAARQRALPASGVLFGNCVIATYLIELFVRGSGYFTPSAVLLVASLWIVSRSEASSRSGGGGAPG
jgi:hypothetical protein